ncbi:MAG TPA: T9SS type A sorting domain-containing protein [Bacteroidia bacterium]|nr:T9SS type A sorting domain-containing protein [Bacteroidia bacterium]
MKKIYAFIFALLVFSKSYCQYYDMSSFSATEYSGHAWMSLDAFKNDQYGNCFTFISDHPCYACTLEQYIKWSGPSGWGSLYWTYGTGVQIFADKIGEVFIFGTVSGQKKIIKVGTPSWDIVTNANSISANDSGYCFALRSDSIKLYSPSGALLWARPGGGTQILGKNNLSYIVNTSTGIKKFQPNGTIAWQSPITGSFSEAPHNRIKIKQGVTVYEVSISTGQVVSVHAGATKGSWFDNDGNGYSYSGNTLTKYDSSGVAWTTHLTGTNFDNIGFDMYNNVYFANFYMSHEQNSYGEWVNPPIQIFVPPTLFVDPVPLSGAASGYYAVYQGRINQQNKLNVKITTGDIKAICKKSTTPVPFTVNQFQVGFEDGFRAELSDASGSFSNPMVLGTGIFSPITANTPFFNPSGNKYKIRVVSNNPEVIGKAVKVSQFAYPPPAEILVSNMFFPDGGTSPTCCAPGVLVAPPGNYTYQWFKKSYGINGYVSLNKTNDTLTGIYSGGDGYKVIITDTATGCPSTGWRTNFYTNGGIVHPDFFLPDTVQLNDGPVELSSGYGGGFSGTGVSDNKFYPDSAGTGLHPILWQTTDLAPCFATADTTKFIFVRNWMKAISAVHISPLKEGYCSGDTLIVSFSCDSTLFNSSNTFNVQLGTINIYSGNFTVKHNIGTGTSSPVTCVIPANINIYNSIDTEPYRIRVVSTSPVFNGTLNYEGNLKVGAPDEASLAVNGGISNCAPLNSLITLIPGSYRLPVYYWHFNSQAVTDSIILTDDGYNITPHSNGSTFLAVQSGDYSVEIVNEFGCHSFSDTIHAGSSPIPYGTVSPATAFFCPGDSALITLQTYNINMIQWLKNDIAFSPPDPHSFYVNTNGQYTVIMTNPISGCFLKKQNAVTAWSYSQPYTIITATGLTTGCEGKKVKLNAYSSSSYHYEWLKNGIELTGTGTHKYFYNASETGLYQVRITDITTGCTATTVNGITITINPLPVATITPQGPVTFCAGDSVVLSANTGSGLTYKWKKNSGFITGATAIDYAALTAGNYQVQVTNSFSCSTTSAAVTVSVPCRESEAEDENAFNASVFPNPSNGDFNFEFSNSISETISIEILDIVGKSISTVQVNSSEYTIPKGELSVGIYSAVISDGNQQRVLKLVKTD